MPEDDTSVERLIHIVRGYHRYTSTPEQAVQNHLENRFAVILDPFQPIPEEWDFDVELLLAILTAISSVIDCDAFIAEINDDTQFHSLAEYCDWFHAMPVDMKEMPRRIQYWKKGKLVCFEETEFWALCGGPAPYHDSYTLSFYTATNPANAFQAACLAACRKINGRVGEIYQGSPTPIPPTFWEWLLEKVFL